MAMKLFFISSGVKTLSHLDPNIIAGFKQIEKKGKIPFKFDYFLTETENIETLYFRVKNFNPDIIISLKGHIPLNILGKLKSLKIPIGIWVADDPYMITFHLKKARPFHFVITEDSGCLPVYQKNKIKAIHLPLAVNPRHYHPMKVSNNYNYDISFVGSALPIRLKIIDEMADFLLDKRFIIIGRWWERLKNYSKLKPHIINNTIPPDEVVKYYNGSKIVLNIHRTKNDVNKNPLGIPAYTPNNRTFDIAACRSFQLATCRRDLKNYFDLETEMVCFSNVKDLKEKINYYLKHNDAREQIAKNAYLRTMKEHKYVNRLEELVEILKKEVLKNKK